VNPRGVHPLDRIVPLRSSRPWRPGGEASQGNTIHMRVLGTLTGTLLTVGGTCAKTSPVSMGVRTRRLEDQARGARQPTSFRTETVGPRLWNLRYEVLTVRGTTFPNSAYNHSSLPFACYRDSGSQHHTCDDSAITDARYPKRGDCARCEWRMWCAYLCPLSFCLPSVATVGRIIAIQRSFSSEYLTPIFYILSRLFRPSAGLISARGIRTYRHCRITRFRCLLL